MVCFLTDSPVSTVRTMFERTVHFSFITTALVTYNGCSDFNGHVIKLGTDRRYGFDGPLSAADLDQLFFSGDLDV